MANWTQTEIGEIWEKAEYIDEKNESNGFRKDQCGAWIKWSDYGNRNSKYGWEIDHIKPASKGGDDVISNTIKIVISFLLPSFARKEGNIFLNSSPLKSINSFPLCSIVITAFAISNFAKITSSS